MVDPPDQGGSVAGQRERVEAPQRPGVVEALGEQIPDCAPQLLIGERIGPIRLGDVPAEVHVGRLNPGRPAKPQAGLLHPLAEPRKGPDPFRDLIAKPVDRERLTVGAGGDDQNLPRVALDRG